MRGVPIVQLTIRPLRPEDAPKLRDLLSAAVVFSSEEIKVATELVELGDAEAAANGYRFLVADDRGAPLGYACHGPASFSEGTWELYWIAVLPDRQRRGVGSALLAAVEAAASAEGARRMFIETSSKPSYAPAREFYESIGCDEVARLPDFYSGGDDKVIYGKSLAAGEGGARRWAPPAIRVRESPGRGRGVFASRAFAAGETIERAPVVVITAEDWERIGSTGLGDFVVRWNAAGEDRAIGLGYASLYNHSFSPNARYVFWFTQREIDVVAIRAISSDEEIFVNYNGKPDDPSPVGFEVR
jgi:GNAT superfamily N-acetyltransferase